MMQSKDLSNVFCSIQRALLGKITPNLRAVYIEIENETSFNLIFYYDKNLSEEEEELTSLIDTEFISDFPSPVFKTNYVIHVVEYPNKISKIGHCTYMRYES